MTSDRELPVPDAAVEMLSRTITAQLTLSATGHCVNTRDHDAVRAIAGPVVAAVLADSVAFVERAIREERDRLPDDRYDSHEAYEVCSGHLLGLLKLYAGGEAAVEALRAAEEERQP